MEKNTEITTNESSSLEVLKSVLDKVDKIEEKKISTLNERKEDLGRELDIASAKFLVDQQNYTDYLNPDAEIAQKLVAYTIDIVSIAVISFFVVSTLLLSLKASLPQVHSVLFSNRMIELMVLTYLFNYCCYFTILEGRRASTIGKHFMNIKVIDEFGLKLSSSQSFLRCLLSLITFGKGQDYFTNNRVVKA